MKHTALKNDRLPLPALFVNMLFIFIIVLVMVIPVLNVVSISFSSQTASETPGLLLFPRDFTAEGYLTIWNSYSLWRQFLNTAFVSILGTLFHILLSSLAGYILIQQDLPFKKFMVGFIVLTMTIPSELTLVSIYAVNKSYGLTNTYAGLIINGMASGFSVLLMRNYFAGIPKEMMEAARIDGAMELRIFSGIYLRLSVPSLVTVGTLEFMRRWNDITMVVTLISDLKKTTLPIILKWLLFDAGSLSGGTYIYLNSKMAGVVISGLPLVILYYVVQRFFVAGALTGSVDK